MGIEPQVEVTLDWALENETDIRQNTIADKFGENGDPTEQVDGACTGGGAAQNCSGTPHRRRKVGRSCRIVDETREEDYAHVLIRLPVATVGIGCARPWRHSE